MILWPEVAFPSLAMVAVTVPPPGGELPEFAEPLLENRPMIALIMPCMKPGVTGAAGAVVITAAGWSTAFTTTVWSAGT